MKLGNQIKTPKLFKNIITLFSGNVFGQLILISATPFLARSYLPENFGNLAVYSAILAILSLLATMRFEIGILTLPEDESLKLCRFTISSSLLTSLIILTCIPLFNYFTNSSSSWIYLIIPGTFFLSMGNVFQNLSIKNNDYSSVALSKILNTSTFVFSAIIQNQRTDISLITSTMLSHIISSIFLIYKRKSYFKMIFLNFKVWKSDICAIKNHFHYITKLTPASILDLISQHISTLLISNFFNPAVLGYFSMMNKLILTPISLVASSVGQVFLKEFSIKSHEERKNFLLKTWKILIILATIPSLIIYLGGSTFFSFFLGEKWIIAGQMASIAAPLFLLLLVTSPTSTALIVLNGQNFILANILILVIGKIVAIYIGSFFGDFILTLKIMVGLEIFSCLAYNIFLLRKL